MKILPAPGTEQWVPLARKKLSELSARRRALGLPVLSKIYEVEGAQIHMKSMDGLEKARLTGGKAYPVLAPLPNPYPYRGIVAYARVRVAYDYEVQNTGQIDGGVPEGARAIRADSDGNVLVLAEYHNPPVADLPRDPFDQVYGFYVASGGEIILAAPAFHDNTVVFRFSDDEISNVTTVYAYASDGTLLASADVENYFDVTGVVGVNRELPYAGGSTIYAPFILGGGSTGYAAALTFEPPEDAIYPLTTTVPNDTFFVPGADVWAAENDALRARRKTRLAANSSSAIAALRGGALPLGWDFALKSAAPSSAHVSRAVPITATTSDETLSSSVTKRTVTIKYSLPGKDPVSVSLTGTRTSVITTHVPVAGVPPPALMSTKVTYDNWYPDPGEARLFDPRAFLLDTGQPPQPIVDSATLAARIGMGAFWTGTTVTGTGTFGPDSQHMLSTARSEAQAANYTPPLPAYSISITSVTPQAVLDAHVADRPTYDASKPGDPAFCSSALTSGMIIDVVPFARVRDGILLGMFYDPHDVVADKADEIEVYGRARLRYDNTSGQLSFVAWTPLPAATDGKVPDSKRVPLPAGQSWPTYNAVLIYHGSPWKDVVPERDPLATVILAALSS